MEHILYYGNDASYRLDKQIPGLQVEPASLQVRKKISFQV